MEINSIDTTYYSTNQIQTDTSVNSTDSSVQSSSEIEASSTDPYVGQNIDIIG